MNVRLGGEKATICIQLERGAWSAESEGEIQTQTSAEQSWPDWCVCDQWRNGSNSEMMLTVELHWSFTDGHSRAAEACPYSISHSEECNKQSHIAAQQDLSFVDTIILQGMPWLGLVFLSR